MTVNIIVFGLILVSVIISAEQEIDEVSIEDIFDIFVPKYTNFETLHDDKNRTIKYNNQTRTLLLGCNSNKINDVIPPFKTKIVLKQLLIIECLLPTTPLIDTLVELNIDPNIEMLQLCIPSVNPLPAGNYTEGLSVKTIWIDSRYSPINNVLSNNPDFLQPLNNLTTLIVWATTSPRMPENAKLEVLSLRHDVWTDSWSKCEHLRELRLHNLYYAQEIPDKWPSNCSSLTTIRLKGLTRTAGEKIVSTVGEQCKNLTSLYIQSCNQTNLPYAILRVAKGLMHLNLSRNRIIDQAFDGFPVMTSLTHLDLSMNFLQGWFLTELVKKIPAIRYLNLNANRFTELFCDYEQKTFSLASLQSLEYLSLNKMQYRPRCFLEHRFPKLKYLGMASDDKIDSFLLRELPRTNSSHLEVDLRDRKILDLTGFIKHAYEATKAGDPSGFWDPTRGKVYENTNITLLINHFNCDCNNYWLARAMRETKQNYLSMPGAQCWPSGRYFNDEPLDNMNCLKYEREPCTIKSFGTYFTKEFDDKLATADCHNPRNNYKYIMPNNLTLIGLNISGGTISRLAGINPLPKSLEWLDLRNNNISRLNDTDIGLLFPNRERKVWLKGNLIFCDCTNKNLLDALHSHQNQIMDFNELICLETGRPLQSVTSYEVCETELKIIIGVFVVFIFFLLLTLFFLWQYRLQVRIYLYSRGWCLFCIQEELDADRPYDAFLSFAHGDDEYVLEHLLPRLEGEPDLYRVCIHYRDWVVGDWIPSQIMRSVQESKRTIIVLSRNFVNSMWGSLEFRYAIASTAEEGYSRLLVLILDDVLSDKLDAEIQGYLSFNTYLRCDDPWFWEKLRYAMPKRKRKQLKVSPVIHDLMESMHLNSVQA